MNTSGDLWHPIVVKRVLTCSNVQDLENLRSVNRKFRIIVDHYISFSLLRSKAELSLSAPRSHSVSNTRRHLIRVQSTGSLKALKEKSPTPTLATTEVDIATLGQQKLKVTMQLGRRTAEYVFPQPAYTERPFYYSQYQQCCRTNTLVPSRVVHLVIDNGTVNNEDLKKILKCFQYLNILNINNLELVSDVGLEHISTLLPNLTALDFSGNRFITDIGVKKLKRLKLYFLNLGGSKGTARITNEGLRDIAKIHTLTDLRLSECISFTDAGLSKLLKLKLQILDIHECDNITDIGICSLARISSLQALWIGGRGRLLNESLEFVQKTLPRIKIIRTFITTIEFKPLKLRHSRPFYFSEYLHLKKNGIPIPPTEHLIIDATDPFNDYDLQTTIVQFPNLKSLTIDRLELLSDMSLIHIGTYLRTLETLQFCGNRFISDIGIKALEALPLRYLDLGSSQGACGITDEGLEILAGITTLQHLKISECLGITDAGLLYLLNLNLQDLDIRECNNISDIGIQYVADMGALQMLYIGGKRLPKKHRLTEVGIAKLITLTHLEKLVLASSFQDINEEARNRLKQLGLPLHDF